MLSAVGTVMGAEAESKQIGLQMKAESEDASREAAATLREGRRISANARASQGASGARLTSASSELIRKDIESQSRQKLAGQSRRHRYRMSAMKAKKSNVKTLGYITAAGTLLEGAGDLAASGSAAAAGG
jgi:hypothetical protein